MPKSRFQQYNRRPSSSWQDGHGFALNSEIAGGNLQAASGGLGEFPAASVVSFGVTVAGDDNTGNLLKKHLHRGAYYADRI